MLQSGQSPTVLQLLCTLPFQYFSNPALTSILYPTLLACCSNNTHNRVLVESEICFDVCLSNNLYISYLKFID